jgi:hypothetical protein
MATPVWTTPKDWTAAIVSVPDMQAQVSDNMLLHHQEISDLGIVQRAQSFRGLHLRTAIDPSEASGIVSLLGVDEIVLSDGARYTPASTIFPLSANLNSSGAGGLDTGSKLASKWYELYLIGKSTTKAPADLRLIFHRAKEYAVDQSQTTDDISEKLRIGATDRVKLAQGFKATAAPIEYIDVKLSRVGTIAVGNYTVTFTIETDTAGSPSGSVQATSDPIKATSISTTAQIVRVPFRTPFTPASGATQYHLVMQGTYAVSVSDYIQWQGAIADVYANGSAKKFDGTTWTGAAASDFYFKLIESSSNGALTFPAGWDESCRVGYVYNSAANTLVPFIAHDRFVRLGYSLLFTAHSETIPTLNDLAAVIPPGRISVDAAVAGSVSGDLIEVDGVPDGVLLGPGRMFMVTGVNSSALDNVSGIATEFQALYAYRFSGSGTFDLYVTGYRW